MRGGPSLGTRCASKAIVVLLAICTSGLLPTACRAPAPRHDVLLITIDTLRADFVHAYGFEHETTPSIDALAARGALFEQAIAAASLTAPAHASIMTSHFVREHSIGTLNGETTLEGGVTLAEIFSEAGYDTAAFVSNVVLRRRSGLDRGFAHYDDELVHGEVNRRAYFERDSAGTGRLALDWLEARSGEKPFFLWVHLQDPHGPYTPPPDFIGRVGEVPLRMTNPLPVLADNHGRAGIPAYQALAGLELPAQYAGRYAEEIAYADHWVGRIVEGARTSSGARGMVVLLTSDHGESMGEAGYFFQHGQSTTPDVALVPLIVTAPQLPAARHEEIVSHVDVAPTLLELAGLGAMPDASGVSLAPLMQHGRALPERSVYCDTEGEVATYSGAGYTRAGGERASSRVARPGPSLQFETVARGAGRTWRPAQLDEASAKRLVDYLESRAPLVGAGVMDAEQIEQLRALGYLPPLEQAAEDDANPARN